MKTESPALNAIFQALNQLSKKLRENHAPQDRTQVLREMRMLLADADKIIDSEMEEA